MELRIDERELPSATLELRFEHADGRAVEDGEVRLWSADDLHGVRLWHQGGGSYIGRDLVPGRYRLAASRPTASWVERTVKLRAGEHERLEPLRLERTGH